MQVPTPRKPIVSDAIFVTSPSWAKSPIRQSEDPLCRARPRAPQWLRPALPVGHLEDLGAVGVGAEALTRGVVAVARRDVARQVHPQREVALVSNGQRASVQYWNAGQKYLLDAKLK